ncbi:hypothetical protein AB1I58_08325 [Enterococcus hirae]|uniref:hypothetical protein n=1 Tax=Enterococcus hirae TaxID=1354 RepID=UPI001D939786|nr:hypothetical protein [Enterococcus hirae]
MKQKMKRALPDLILLLVIIYLTTINTIAGIIMVIALFAIALLSEGEGYGRKNIQ